MAEPKPGLFEETAREEARRSLEKRAAEPIKAKRAQNFDTDGLPLFGDGHKQRELF